MSVTNPQSSDARYGPKIAAVVSNGNVTLNGAITVTFAQPVGHYSVQNNSAAPCMVNEDAVASAGSYRIYASGQNAIRDVPCTVLSLFCSTAGISVNGATDLGIVVEGWL